MNLGWVFRGNTAQFTGRVSYADSALIGVLYNLQPPFARTPLYCAMFQGETR